ncbi:MAG: hypothetical protein CL534_12740 [Ahrensia sp.]|nr:hypothetical protein [Ahrensia sp.]
MTNPDQPVDHAASPTPYLDSETLSFFEQRASQSKCYLEYGCGGSTVHAIQKARIPSIISVESDKEWRQKVLDSVQLQSPDQLRLEHCDIGPVGAWGVPIDQSHIRNYWRYSCLPWQIARNHNLSPDFVMIDGRFRVASFLYSLISCKDGTTILFDDYYDRPSYHTVEQFCEPPQKVGRAAVFESASRYEFPAIAAKLAEFSIVPG